LQYIDVLLSLPRTLTNVIGDAACAAEASVTVIAVTQNNFPMEIFLLMGLPFGLRNSCARAVNLRQSVMSKGCPGSDGFNKYKTER
jgi:hypothetical protein